MSERALVTGGFGFVGSQLCRTLVERGTEVAVLDDLSVGSPENLPEGIAEDVRSLIGDVRDLEAVDRRLDQFRPSVVVHLAKVTSSRRASAIRRWRSA